MRLSRRSAREVLIEVAFSVISTGTEASRVAETDLKSRLITGWQTARLGAERLRSAGIEETLRKARARDAVKGPIGYSVAGIIRAVGEGISDLAPGMLVAAAGSGFANHAEMVVVPATSWCGVGVMPARQLRDRRALRPRRAACLTPGG
jgi:hypothetical protein